MKNQRKIENIKINKRSKKKLENENLEFFRK